MSSLEAGPLHPMKHHEQPKKTTLEFKVLSYNLFLRPPFISQPKGDYKTDRLSLFIHTVLPNYELICLQEFFTAYSSRVNKLIHHAEHQGFQTCCLGPQKCLYKLHFVDSGLITLSKWPTVMSKTHVFTCGVSADRFSAKGVLYTKLKHPTEPFYLHVFNTHLQASYSLYPSSTHPTVQCRSHQLQEFITFLKTMVTPPASSSSDDHLHDLILVLGDFNIDKLDPNPMEYQSLLQLLQLENTYKVTEVLANQDSTWTHRSWNLSDENKAHLDYVFLLTPLHPPCSMECDVTMAQVEPFPMEKKAFPRLSDHSAVSVTFHFSFSHPSPGFVSEPVPISPSSSSSSQTNSTSVLPSTSTSTSVSPPPPVPSTSPLSKSLDRVKPISTAKKLPSPLPPPLIIPKYESKDEFLDAHASQDWAT